MLFYFRHLCKLFDTIDGLGIKNLGNISIVIHTWFDEHNAHIPRYGPGAIAFLSCLFPERRLDRVLEVYKSDLERIIQSAHGLG
jgi:DNA ligase 4